jgi:hypothetical protein
MSKKQTEAFVKAQIMLAALNKSFFKKMSEKDKEKKISEWTSSIIKQARLLGATYDEIDDIFTHGETIHDIIQFTKAGEIKIPALEPDDEILEIIESMDKKAAAKIKAIKRSETI